MDFWKIPLLGMFKKKTDKEKIVVKEEFTLKYQKPKILLIDLPEAAFKKVRDAGFNAQQGTFGSPYKVESSNEYKPLITRRCLPNFTEQEIIIIDLKQPETLNEPEGGKIIDPDGKGYYIKPNRKRIDPRAVVMLSVKHDFDRILSYGGLFVIFAEPRLEQDIVYSKYVLDDSIPITDTYKFEKNELKFDNWSFLSFFDPGIIKIEADSGREISLPDHRNDHPFFQFIKKTIKNFEISAIFQSSENKSFVWLTIMYNKYRNDVGGIIFPKLEDGKLAKGRVIILPQIADKSDAIVTLLKEILPEISPHLFPDIEGQKWVEREEYEHVEILEYKSQKIKEQSILENKLIALDEKISEARRKLDFLHGIILKKSDELVQDIKKSLEYIGFKDVRNVDEGIKNGTKGMLQEDLQVHDKSPILLIEIKGISGLPKEKDTLQVEKYLSRRMKEFGRTDIHGVSIINHQRSTPGLERDNQNVFSQQQLEDAENHDITILTTWDLFLLIKGMIKWRWDPKVIRELFFKKGRMPRIPLNYKLIGRITHYWEKIKVLEIEILDDEIKKGQRIGYITENGYLEEEIQSMKINMRDVERAVQGESVTIKTQYSKKELLKNTIVYKVIEDVG